jgi:hypothetical protein
MEPSYISTTIGSGSGGAGGGAARLNIMDLHREMNIKNEKMIQCFDMALKRCHSKIRICSGQKQLKCFFEVPEFMVGCPLYDLNKCITYVMTELKANGFFVQYYFPKWLYISWDLQEIEENKKKEKEMRKQGGAPKTVDRDVPQIDFKYKPSGKLSLHI